jgi:hypothetical protein
MQCKILMVVKVYHISCNGRMEPQLIRVWCFTERCTTCVEWDISTIFSWFQTGHQYKSWGRLRYRRGGESCAINISRSRGRTWGVLYVWVCTLRQIAHIDRIVCYLYLFVYHCPYKTFPVWKVDFEELFFLVKCLKVMSYVAHGFHKYHIHFVMTQFWNVGIKYWVNRNNVSNDFWCIPCFSYL